MDISCIVEQDCYLVEQDLRTMKEYDIYCYKEIGNNKLLPIIVMHHFTDKESKGVFNENALTILTGQPITGLGSLIDYLMDTNDDIVTLLRNAMNEKTDKELSFGKNIPYIRTIINKDNGDVGILFMNAIFAASGCFWGEENLTPEIMSSEKADVIRKSYLSKSLRWYTEQPKSWGMPLFILECFTAGFKAIPGKPWKGEEYKHMDKWKFTQFPYAKKPNGLYPEKFFPISSPIKFVTKVVSNEEFVTLAKFQEKLN